MQKIMFNDAYGLTQATIEGRKTMTRRTEFDEVEMAKLNIYAAHGERPVVEGNGVIQRDSEGPLLFPKPTRYRLGEVVAVARRYADIPGLENMAGSPGWGNKMFTKAELMPHRIRITGLRAERLQDISDEDCLREGVRKFVPNFPPKFPIHPTHYVAGSILRDTPREAFAVLIDKVSGRGTWARNPWVVAYEYEFVK